MTDVTRDGQTSAQHQPGMTSGDSPREPFADPFADPDYQAWKASQKDSANQTESDKPKDKATSVQTGRKAAPTETVKQDRPVQVEEEEVIPQSYVWLANGNVLLVDNEDLPDMAGPDALYGYWHEKDGDKTKVHTIVNVYPVENTVGE